ncbi:hypothetical protein H6P81_010378 [Aristolochia fimbriata]|uniref:Uncharacterized protein n=1 Tax=Aristolochia fimbriata TaxID=158543 RepID=A0AAV7ENK6_ARIFI|nr:hypothetical protein H6P81_010378 [Aristolochia fimbriata]
MDGVDSKLNRPIRYEEGPIGAKIKALRMNENISLEIICLARGPKHNVASYHGFFVNGYKFETIIVDHLRVTQNSGVASIGKAEENFCGGEYSRDEVVTCDEVVMPSENSRDTRAEFMDDVDDNVLWLHRELGTGVRAEVVEKFRGIEDIDPTDPRAPSSVLDKVYKGHHGGYERG